MINVAGTPRTPYFCAYAPPLTSVTSSVSIVQPDDSSSALNELKIGSYCLQGAQLSELNLTIFFSHNVSPNGCYKRSLTEAKAESILSG